MSHCAHNIFDVFDDCRLLFCCRFNNHSQLRQHKIQMHGFVPQKKLSQTNPEKRVVCTICGKDFKNSSVLCFHKKVRSILLRTAASSIHSLAPSFRSTLIRWFVRFVVSCRRISSPIAITTIVTTKTSNTNAICAAKCSVTTYFCDDIANVATRTRNVRYLVKCATKDSTRPAIWTRTSKCITSKVTN